MEEAPTNWNTRPGPSVFIYTLFFHKNLFKCNASVNVSTLRILRILSKWSTKKGRTKIMYFCKSGALLLSLRYIHFIEVNRFFLKKILHEVWILWALFAIRSATITFFCCCKRNVAKDNVMCKNKTLFIKQTVVRIWPTAVAF